MPVRGQCSLDAIGAAHGGDVTVVTDARRKEVYWATYSTGARTDGPRVTAPDDVEQGPEIAGRGARLYPESFGKVAIGLDDPDPAWIARLVDGRVASGETKFPTDPMYLRRPDVHGA